MIFWSSISSKKMNERIRLYYYDTSSGLVFVRFLDKIEDTKKTFRNHLTFSNTYFKFHDSYFFPRSRINVSCLIVFLQQKIWDFLMPAIMAIQVVEFSNGFIKSRRVLLKNQHTPRNFLNFENWTIVWIL